MRQVSQLDRKLQRYAREYLKTNQLQSIDLDTFVAWLFENDYWEPDLKRIKRLLRADVSHALSEERFTDPDGQRVRKYLFVKKKQHGEQLSLAIPMETISRGDMVLSLQLRRRDIVARLLQIKVDIDHFNKFVNKEEPVQTSFNFTYEIKEAEAEKVTFQKTVSSSVSRRLSSQSHVSARQSASSRVPSHP